MKARYHGRGLPYFAGPVYQRGHGLGSLFRGLFRFAMPFIKQGASTIGRQALQTGIQVAGDVLDRKPIQESLRSRVREAGDVLKLKAANKVNQLLTGSGKRRARKRKSQSVRFGPPDRKRKVHDIFD